MMSAASGERIERPFAHEGGQVRSFYAALQPPVRVGIEASGAVGWFEQLLGELGHELWIGNAGAIRAAAPRRQKTDVRDARLLLRQLIEERFPRIWLPSLEERDARQLLMHRSKLAGMRTALRNQRQALALGERTAGRGPGDSAGLRARHRPGRPVPLEPAAGQ